MPVVSMLADGGPAERHLARVVRAQRCWCRPRCRCVVQDIHLRLAALASRVTMPLGDTVLGHDLD